MSRKEYKEGMDMAMQAESMPLCIADPDAFFLQLYARADLPAAEVEKRLSAKDVTPAGWASAGEGVEL